MATIHHTESDVSIESLTRMEESGIGRPRKNLNVSSFAGAAA